MKINNLFKITIIFCTFVSFCIPLFSASEDNFSVDFGGQGVTTEVTTLTNNTFGTAISIARTVGYVASAVILMVIACKYIIASPGDRADIKKNAVPFVIGAFVLFGSNAILGIIIKLSETIK